MLKIKDNVDLKEIFENVFVGDFDVMTMIFGNDRVVCYASRKDEDLIIRTDTREIKIYGEDCYELLFDLTEAGFVEKIEE